MLREFFIKATFAKKEQKIIKIREEHPADAIVKAMKLLSISELKEITGVKILNNNTEINK